MIGKTNEGIASPSGVDFEEGFPKGIARVEESLDQAPSCYLYICWLIIRS